MSNYRLSRPAGWGEGVKVHDGSLHAPPKPDTTGSAAAARTINFGWPHRLNEAGEEKQAHRHKCFAPSIKSVRQLALQTNAENAATRWEKRLRRNVHAICTLCHGSTQEQFLKWDFKCKTH